MSQERDQKTWLQAMASLVYGIKAGISCAYLAKVTRFDKKHRVADVQPLANVAEGGPSAQVLDVPVAVNLCALDSLLGDPLIAKGACVVCVVLDHDSGNWDGDATEYDVDSNRTHSMTDSIVVGVI